jgi:hypothetical protein
MLSASPWIEGILSTRVSSAVERRGRRVHEDCHDGHSAAQRDGSVYDSRHREKGKVRMTDWQHREQIES